MSEVGTPVKRMPNNAKWAIEDGIALAQKGIAEITKMHQAMNEPATMHKLMDLIIIFQQIESSLKTIRMEETKCSRKRSSQ